MAREDKDGAYVEILSVARAVCYVEGCTVLNPDMYYSDDMVAWDVAARHNATHHPDRVVGDTLLMDPIQMMDPLEVARQASARLPHVPDPTELPEAQCEMGYTRAQLGIILGNELETFDSWMRGQTMAICEGKQYNHDTKEFEEMCHGVMHGPVVYSDDLSRYLAGLPIID